MLSRLGKDIAVYGSADFVFRLIGFAVFPVYAHVFSVSEFGIYALVSATAGVISLLSNLGLNAAMVRHYMESPPESDARAGIVSTGLLTLLAWSCAVVLLVFAALVPVRDIVDSRYGISWSIACVALLAIVPELILQYSLDVLRVRFSPWHFVIVAFFKNTLGVAIGLVLVLAFGAGLEGLFLGALAGATAAVPLALAFIRRDLVPRFAPKLARRLIAYGYPLVFAGLAYWFFGSVDRWMLIELSDATQLGLYAIAYKFAGVVVFLNGAFGQAWGPTLLKLHRDDPDYRAIYARMFSAWFFVLVVAASIMALFGKEALQLLTPAEYWSAAPVLAILVMGTALFGTTQLTVIGISLEKRTRLLATAAWFTAAANVILNLVLIPRWGAIGAAAATFVSYGILTGLFLYLSQRLHPIPLETRRLLYSVLLIACTVGVAFGAGGLQVSPALVAAKLVLIGLMVAGGFVFRVLDLAAMRQMAGRKVPA